MTDDGSGAAAVMELARVMSRYQFDKTIVFIALAAESPPKLAFFSIDGLPLPFHLHRAPPRRPILSW